MTIEPIVFFVLIIAILILCLCLGALVISYAKFAHMLNALHKEKSNIEDKMLKKSDGILDEAREKAIKIVANANLFEDSAKTLFDQELKRTTEAQIKTLEKLSYDFLRAFQKELIGLKDNNIKTMGNISKDIESSVVAELKDYREILKKETYGSQKIVETKIEEAYKTAQIEIEDYKAAQFKKVEIQIYDIIQNVSKIVLNKTLSLQEHEQLVIDALEKAKKEGTL